jgi:hypothetical protein
VPCANGRSGGAAEEGVNAGGTHCWECEAPCGFLRPRSAPQGLNRCCAALLLQAELINGRSAMIGIAALLVVEGVRGMALF